MNDEKLADLVKRGKTWVNGEICCVRDCKKGFDYSEVPGYKPTLRNYEEGFVFGLKMAAEDSEWQPFPRGWIMLVSGDHDRVGFLCPKHAKQFPTVQEAQRNLKLFDIEKMMERPDDA